MRFNHQHQKLNARRQKNTPSRAKAAPRASGSALVSRHGPAPARQAREGAPRRRRPTLLARLLRWWRGATGAAAR